MPPKTSSLSSTPAAAIDSPERRRLPVLLRRAWYGLNQAFRRRIQHLGLTPDQFTVIRNLLEHEGLTQRELTALMSSDPNTIASLLERMEKAGVIQRRADEKDRRAKRVRLNPLGKKTYEAARRIAVELQTEILSVLPRERSDRFLEDLNAVADACRKASDRSPRKRTN
jgi:DNA-binding MarR family transcriptional regulator